MKKRVIEICILGIIFLILGTCMLYSSSKNKFVQDGVTYALTLDGASVNTFPAKGMYQVNVECNNAIGKWDYDAWKLYIEDLSSNKITCDIDFTTIEKINLNTYITNLAGQTQGDGQVVNEIATIANPTFTKLEQSGYSNLSNDATFPFSWDSSNKTWTSTNKEDSTTSTITFNPNSNGYYQICYVQSSEKNYDYARVYKNNSEILNLKGIGNTEFACQYLGNLSTSDTIKVTYTKDASTSTGNDNVVFYLQSGNYNENIGSAGIRYEGKNPNNYVWFNNELWRIIGVFDSNSHGLSGQNLVKIIRNELIGGLELNKSSSYDWTQSSLINLLNGAYLNSEDGTDSGYCFSADSILSNCDYTAIGIKETARNMIATVTWYLRGTLSESATAGEFYNYERKTGTIFSGRPTETTEKKKIGLIYPSDYGFSVLAGSCARTTNLGDYDSATCAGESWLYGQGDEWTITPNVSGSNSTFVVQDYGSVYGMSVNGVSYTIRPVLYLDSNVYVIDGSGNQSDPYIIGM